MQVSEMRSDDNFLNLIRDKLGGKKIITRKNITAVPEFQLAAKLEDSNQLRQNPTQVIDDFTLSLRTEIIMSKKISLSSNSDFEKLDDLLSEAQTLNYEQFLEYSSQASPPAQRFFTAQYFLMFPKDGSGAISSEKFLRSVYQIMANLRRCLCCCE